jgi:hypothetical protein
MTFNQFESVTMEEWIQQHYSEDELRALFLNMDVALKYIHDHGYCIEKFHPSQIKVLNNDVKEIQFNKLVELSSDFSLRKEMIKEDIFNSSLIQIGIYSNTFSSLTPSFIKENFDSFVQFIPEGDVPYYRGVIQRGASVYLCEYTLEKTKRDYDDLESQLASAGGDSTGKALVKSSNNIAGIAPINNDLINDKIYKQINGMSESAFVNILIVPTIVLCMLLLFTLLTLLFGMFHM